MIFCHKQILIFFCDDYHDDSFTIELTQKLKTHFNTYSCYCISSFSGHIFFDMHMGPTKEITT